MTDEVRVKLCILWEDELRAAAKLLRALPTVSDEDYPEAASAALMAAATALWGVADDHCVVMLGAASLRQWHDKSATSTVNANATQEE